MKRELKKVLDYISNYNNMVGKYISEHAHEDPYSQIKTNKILKDFYITTQKIFDGFHELGIIKRRIFYAPSPYRKRIKKEE